MGEQGVDETSLRGQVAAQSLRTAILAGDLVEQPLEFGDVAIDRLLEAAVGAVFAGDFIECLLADLRKRAPLRNRRPAPKGEPARQIGR